MSSPAPKPYTGSGKAWRQRVSETIDCLIAGVALNVLSGAVLRPGPLVSIFRTGGVMSDMAPVFVPPRMVEHRQAGKRILLAASVGETGRRAVALTDAIASRWGAIVTVVGAGVPQRGPRTPHYSPGAPMVHPSAPEARLGKLRGELAEELREVASDSACWSGEILETDFEAAIAVELRHHQPDLLVVSAAGPASTERELGLEKMLTVLRDTRVPVLVVPPAGGTIAGHDGGRDLTRAVVATDFGQVAERAGQAVVDIVARPAALLLAHVEPPAISPVLGDPDRHTAAYRAALPAQFMRARTSLASRSGFAPATIETEVLSGEPLAALWTAALRWNADVIAVGMEKFSKLMEPILRSVTKGLLQAALGGAAESRQPVLLVVP